jgi:hypothetical protein
MSERPALRKEGPVVLFGHFGYADELRELRRHRRAQAKAQRIAENWRKSTQQLGTGTDFAT